MIRWLPRLFGGGNRQAASLMETGVGLREAKEAF